MKKKDLDILYKLFRDHEDVIGSTNTTILAIESFIESIRQLRCSKEGIKKQIFELSEAIKNTEPKIMALIHLIEMFEDDMKKENNFDKKTVEEVKECSIRILGDKIGLMKSNLHRLIDHGVPMIKDKDTIIIHSPSTVVKNILMKAKVSGKKYRIILLKQDEIKTKQIIRRLKKENIEHIVVPEYNLSQVIGTATKMMIGATSVSTDGKIITAVGKGGVVSMCHINKVPVYLFVNSLKFSHKSCKEQNVHRKKVKKSHHNIDYSMIQHSHDVIDLKFIDKIFTEKGEITKVELKKEVKC